MECDFMLYAHLVRFLSQIDIFATPYNSLDNILTTADIVAV